MHNNEDRNITFSEEEVKQVEGALEQANLLGQLDDHPTRLDFLEPVQKSVQLVEQALPKIRVLVGDSFNKMSKLYTHVFEAIINDHEYQDIIFTADEGSGSNPTYEDCVECLKQLALIHPTIAAYILKNHDTISKIKASKQAYEHLVQIGEKHGNHYFTLSSKKITIILTGIYDDGQLSGCSSSLFNEKNFPLRKITWSKEKMTETLFRIAIKHEDFAEHAVVIYLNSVNPNFYTAIDLKKIVELTKQYPSLAHKFILKLSKTKNNLPFFHSLIVNLKTAVFHKDIKSMLTLAILQFSGVLSQHVKQNVKNAVELLFNVKELFYANATIGNHSVIGRMYCDFAMAFYKGEPLDSRLGYKFLLTVYDIETLSYNVSKDNDRRFYFRAFGEKIEKNLFIAEKLLQFCNSTYCTSKDPCQCCEMLNSKSFQSELTKAYVSHLSLGDIDLAASNTGWKLFNNLVKGSTIPNEGDSFSSEFGEFYFSMAAACAHYMKHINADPFFSINIAYYFLDRNDLNTVYSLLQTTIINAKHHLGNPELKPIKKDLDSVLSEAYSVCYTLAVRFMCQGNSNNLTQINVLLSLIPQGHSDCQKARGILNTFELPYRSDLELTKNDSKTVLSEAKQQEFINSLYAKAANCGHKAEKLIVSGLGNENKMPTAGFWANLPSTTTSDGVESSPDESKKFGQK